MKKKYSIEDYLYVIGIGIPILLFLGVIVFLFLNSNMPGFLKFRGCYFYQITGFYCPGCGGTRAVIALFQGKIVQSFLYHPLVLYTAGVYLVFMITQTLERLHVFKIKGIKFRPIYLYLAIIILLFHFIFENLFLLLK